MRKNKARMALRTFYGFDYHTKMCTNIAREINGKRNLSSLSWIQERYEQLLDRNCSERAINQFAYAARKEKGQKWAEYVRVWKRLSKQLRMGNFSNEKFNVSGRFINDLTIMVVNSTIVTYEDMHDYCLQGNRWSYDSTFLFIGSVATTIGYGNVVPETEGSANLCSILPFYHFCRSLIRDKQRAHPVLRIQHYQRAPVRATGLPSD